MKMDIKVKTVLKYMTMLIGCFVICVLSLVLDDSYRVRAEEEIWEIEDNDSPGMANEVPLMTKINGQLWGKKGYDTDMYDYYSFTIPENGCVWLTLQIEYEGENIPISGEMAIHSQEKFALVDYFGGWERNTPESSSSKKIGLSAGTYFLDFFYASIEKYSFIINYEASSDWESVLNSSLPTATLINVGKKYYATKYGIDSDFFSFTLPEDGYIWLSFEHDYVDAIDVFYTSIFKSLDVNIANIEWELRSPEKGDSNKIGLSAGTYYLVVWGSERNYFWDDVISYSFTVNYSPSNCYEKESNNSIIEANEILINKVYCGTLKQVIIVKNAFGEYYPISDIIEDIDWYKIKVEKKGIIRIKYGINSSDNPPTLYYCLYDSDNNVIGEVRRESSIMGSTKDYINVTKGVYYLKLFYNGSFKDDEYSFSVEFSEDGSFNDINEKPEKQSSDSLKKGSKFTVKGIKYKTVDKDEVVVVGVDSALETVKIPATVTVKKNKYAVVGISKGAFKGNKKITRVTIKADLDKIGDNAFSGCKKLKRIDLLGNISEIGRKAFYKCTNLKQIYITTENIKKIGKKALTKTADKATVKVPSGKVNAYKKMLTKAGISKKALIK